MSEEIRCEVHRIIVPNWTTITDESRQRVKQAFTDGVTAGQTSSRRAFVGIEQADEFIVGFFAHEDRRLGVQYDDHWSKEQRAAAEFEHLFFALDLEQGQVILQRKRVDREFVSINMTVLRRVFFELLGEAFLRAGFPSTRIMAEPFRVNREKSELVTIFDTYPVTYVKIKRLLGKSVPDSVHLFNPDADKDMILKQVVQDDLRYLDEFEGKSGSPDESTNLRSAKVVRAMVLAGEPDVVKAVVDDVERTFRQSQTEVFPMQLDAEPGEKVEKTDVERIIKIVRTEYYVPASLISKSKSFGPLFDGLEGEA